MKREIEEKLFAEFENNGAANLCLDYILKMRVNKCDVSCYPLGVQKYYALIPEHVKARTEAFDEVAWPVNVKGQYRIAQEISDNLDACGSESAKERYICGILGVFDEWAKVFTPIADLRTLDKITEANSIYTEKQIKAEKERLRGLHDQMLAVMGGAEVGSIEYYFEHWHRAYFLFSNMLAGVCAEHNINLLEVQNKRGIWVVDKLDVVQLQMYFGYSGNYDFAHNLLTNLTAPNTADLIYIINNGQVVSRGQKVENATTVSTINRPGRPKKNLAPFQDRINGTPDERQFILKKLHDFIDGKKGRDVAFAIRACVLGNKMTRPSFSQVKAEFGQVGNESGYNKYYREFDFLPENEKNRLINYFLY